MNVILGGPRGPGSGVSLDSQDRKAVGQRSRHTLRCGFVLQPIAGSHRHPASWQMIITYASLKHQPEARCLHAEGRSVDLIKLENAKLAITILTWELIRCQPACDTSLEIRHWHATQVNWLP